MFRPIPYSLSIVCLICMYVCIAYGWHTISYNREMFKIPAMRKKKKTNSIVYSVNRASETGKCLGDISCHLYTKLTTHNVCSHHHSESSLEYFCGLQKKTHTIQISSHSPFPFPTKPQVTTNLLSISMDLFFLDILC